MHLSKIELALPLLLAALPLAADTTFTGNGWLTGVPVPGILCTNGSGQVSLKGNVHTLRLSSDDPRIAGRLEAMPNVAFQADGTRQFTGVAYSEVGTWDAAGVNFTPSGGVWDLNYRGVTEVNGSIHYDLVGYGIGGAIDGMRIELVADRGPGATFDPSIRYDFSGVIKSAPVNTRVVVDDFANNQFTWSRHGVGPDGANTGTFFASETNQQLTLGGTWPVTTSTPMQSSAWANPSHPWSVSTGHTIEARVDVIALGQQASGTALALWDVSGSAQAYFAFVTRNHISLAKNTAAGPAFFRAAQASVPGTNIVLSLAVTPVGANIVLTGRALAKDTGATIAEVVVTDTPGSDPTLSASELAEISGGAVWQGLVTDPAASPFASGTAPVIFVVQESGVAPVTATATFDNLELLTYEVPSISVERAVQLSFPKSGMNWGVESAPTPNGPFLPVQVLPLPEMQKLTVPTSRDKQFFRAYRMP